MLFKFSLLFSSIAYAAFTPPSQDPFYQPTGAWASQPPGTILAHRPVPNPLANVTYSAAYQLLYRTIDALNNPIAAVTTVIIPTNADYTKLLSYQIIYDTPDVDCSPSYALQEGGSYLIDDGFTYPLLLGWVVNAPDYEGLKAAFTNGVISGQATLDSIRAALASTGITGVESNATVAMWGYSGGALASEWASELQASYAPELNISGTAMGGTTPNITNVALSVNDHPSAGLIAAGVLGIVAAHPNVSSLLNESFVSAADETAFYAVKKECISQQGVTEADLDILGYFTQGIGLFTDPGAAFAIEAGGIMGIHGTPEKSNRLYVYKSTLDEVSPVADTDALVEKYCEAGANIKYVKDDYGTHAEEAVNGGLGALQFLMSVMGGSYSMEGCLVETRNSASSVIASSTIAATSGAVGSSSSVSGIATVTSGVATSTTVTSTAVTSTAVTSTAATSTAMTSPATTPSATSSPSTSAAASVTPYTGGSGSVEASATSPLMVGISLLGTILALFSIL